MNRETIYKEKMKELLPIIQAAAEGKTIEFRDSDHKYWQKLTVPAFDLDVYKYRIKPEPKYRSFQSVEECWQEMLKHQQFGWLKDKDSELMDIQALTDGVCFRGINLINGWHVFEEAVKEYTFADGTPFGIVEKE